MIRIRTILAAGAAVAMFGLTFAGAASAQEDDYPGTSATTAPPSQACALTAAFSAPALAGATLNVTVSCDGIEATRSYTGSLESTPVALPTTTATVDNVVTFGGVTLPADWQTNAIHRITLRDAGTGATLGSANFFVDRNGRVSAPPSGGGIPRTGSDFVEPGLQIGAGLLAAGTLALVVARRRRAAAAA